jgi:hypothetical protein
VCLKAEVAARSSLQCALDGISYRMAAAGSSLRHSKLAASSQWRQSRSERSGSNGILLIKHGIPLSSAYLADNTTTHLRLFSNGFASLECANSPSHVSGIGFPVSHWSTGGETGNWELETGNWERKRRQQGDCLKPGQWSGPSALIASAVSFPGLRPGLV